MRPRARYGTRAVADWRTLASDADAVFDTEHRVDAADVVPMVTWGTSPQQAVPLGGAVPAFADVSDRDTAEAHGRALDYMGLAAGEALAGLPIDAAFIGSCTNAACPTCAAPPRSCDGRHVAPGVRAICVPGSGAVKAAAEAEGLDRIFLDAGFEWREAGCSMCFFAGGESFGAQQRVISSTNRNFESRQGPETRSHLASPETVAASAIAGRIAARRAALRAGSGMTPFTTLTSIAVPLMRDNIDTDAIIPSREMKTVGKTGLADGLFAGWRYTEVGGRAPEPGFVLNDPAYAGAAILLGGANFGCGSRREHAAWALAEYGFRAVIAPSFNPIFRGNCVRNGIVPIELDAACVRGGAPAARRSTCPRRPSPTPAGNVRDLRDRRGVEGDAGRRARRDRPDAAPPRRDRRVSGGAPRGEPVGLFRRLSEAGASSAS